MLFLLSIKSLENNRIIAALAYVGKYSYSIYLFHRLIDDICLEHFTRYSYYVVYLSSSIIVGIIMSKIIEYPFLKIRDKYFPSRSAPSIGVRMRRRSEA
jgi:peptidoglycan/LPS O-acetylase OafA/YrhL